MLKRFFFALALVLIAGQQAQAANRTEWTAGNNNGYTWTAAFGAADMTSLANGSTVQSTAQSFTNQTAQDQFMDISGVWTVTSATPPAGAYVAIYLVGLNQDGTTSGTGETSSGTTITRALAQTPICVMQIETATATTKFAGNCYNVPIPPGTFNLAVFNGSGASFSSTNANSAVSYRSYNINLNN